MTITIKRAELIKRLEALIAERGLEATKHYAEAKREYALEQKDAYKKLDALRKEIEAGERPDPHCFYAPGPPRMREPDTKALGHAVRLLKMCSDDELKIDASRDKYGIAEAVAEL